MPRPPIRYTVRLKDPRAHLLEIVCAVEDPDPHGQQFQLPAWIPGSYLIRDFARHVTAITAKSRGRPIPIVKTDKQTWIAAAGAAPISVSLEVYARDMSVRGAHFDTTHAFFNGTSVFLLVSGKEERACEVEILRPRGTPLRSWRVATTLRRATAPAFGFGGYRANNYQELIDHPVEIGEFSLARFEAASVPHEIAITGRHDADLGRLSRDLARLCKAHIALFGGPAPFSRYLFLTNVVDEGYGGLEHRASTALLCSRDNLPTAKTQGITETYRTFLGLASHEYFHAWNVKRIKPVAFEPYRLDREAYTSLLWAFEGLTSYYDDLLLVRAGLLSADDYFDILGRSITSLLRNPGRSKQTVSEASWDAWIKYYRPDENSPNSQVSYYLKGSLIGLCLDLTIRGRTQGRKSLDDVMRALWVRYGQTGIGIAEDELERIVAEVSGLRLHRFFDRVLRSTQELPLSEALRAVGLDMQLRAAQSASDRGGRTGSVATSARIARPSLGVRTTEDAAGLRIVYVAAGSAAQAAGLTAGDLLVSWNGLRIDGKSLEKRLAEHQPGDRIMVHFFRRDELFQGEVVVQAAPTDTCTVAVVASDRTGARHRTAWLTG
jgi:predicted metalloprotease with PDZ domain